MKKTAISKIVSIAAMTTTALLVGTGCVVHVRPRPLVVYQPAPPPPPVVVYQPAPPPPPVVYQPAPPPPVIVYPADPPPPQVEIIPVAPAPGMIWIRGVWFRGPRGWAWHRGYWR